MDAQLRVPKRRLGRLALLLCLALSAPSLGAQGSLATRHMATRAELEQEARRLELDATSSAYSADLRARARAELAVVRRRLDAGDLSVGERIAIRVTGGESILDDTLTVLDSIIIDLPGIRRISLRGVLRSELQSRLETEARAVIREAQVTARPLLRIAVLGAVTAPGYRSVPSETLVDQLLAQGGNPASTARIDRMRFVRIDTTIMQGHEILRAIAAGRSLASLDLRDGDALVVPPGSPPWDRAQTIQILLALSAPIMALLLTR
jgi:hypothetical protein